MEKFLRNSIIISAIKQLLLVLTKFSLAQGHNSSPLMQIELSALAEFCQMSFLMLVLRQASKKDIYYV